MTDPKDKLDIAQCVPAGTTLNRETLMRLSQVDSPCGNLAGELLRKWEVDGVALPDDIGVTERQGKMLGVTIPRNFGGG